jgi:DnaJ-domain-containing protein 1
MLKATFKTIRQTIHQAVAGLLAAQAHQKVAMGVATLNKFANQLRCLLLLVQVLLMKKQKAVRQTILVVKNTLKKLACAATAQLKQTVGSFIQTPAPQIHHHAK